jgi:hypothetical protein
LQVAAVISMPLLQLGVAQMVLVEAGATHAPEPLQTPAAPHTPLPIALHSSSGSLPARIGAHAPSAAPVLAALADMHKPVHELFAQKPSTQFPVWHWLAAEHAAP